MKMLARSPLFVGLKRRFAAGPNWSEHDSYRIFTTAFDETVDASDLPGILPKQSPMQANSFEEAVGCFESEFSGERITFGAATAEFVRDLEAGIPREIRARSVVSFPWFRS
jgi:hypothetical protein